MVRISRASPGLSSTRSTTSCGVSRVVIANARLLSGSTFGACDWMSISWMTVRLVHTMHRRHGDVHPRRGSLCPTRRRGNPRRNGAPRGRSITAPAGMWGDVATSDHCHSHVQTNVQTTHVSAGGATAVELTANVPGTYSIVDPARGAWRRAPAAT